MCTCIKYKNNDCYFGRNLDLEYSFGEKVVITPRNYSFSLKSGEKFNSKYAMIGMANVVDNYPLYAEAANEHGLAIAGLYFPNNAYYNNPENGKINLATYEFIPWLLGNYKSIKEVKELLKNLNLVNISFKDDFPLAPLHFMLSDKEDCLVIEQTKEGLKIYKNDVGVLTNNPDFPYHLKNLNNYMLLSPKNPDNNFSQKLDLKSFSEGMGAIGLPGDSSSVSRFVRASFNLTNSVSDGSEEDNVSQFFHILDSVAMVRGTVITANNKFDITTYSCCINLAKGIYYYKTYNNNQINAISMNDTNKNTQKLTIFNLIDKERINYIN